MPTYILHGGEASSDTPTNESFWKLLATSIPAGGTWLGCYFARYNEVAAEKFERDAKKILAFAPEGVTCHMADEDAFEEQLKTADVIYFAGGSTLGLLNNLKRYPNIKTLLQSAKVVAGCSAGMNLLGQKFLTKKGEHGEGLGLISYNLIVHYKAPAYIDAHEANPLPHPTLALMETQFCVIEL